MTNQQIAQELEKRAMNELPRFKKEFGGGIDGISNYLNGIIEKSNPWQDYLVEELNQILEDFNLDFSDEKRKQEMISDIKPNMISLLQEIAKP